MTLHDFEYFFLLASCYAFPLFIVFVHRRVLAKEHFSLFQPSVILAGIPFVLFDIFAVWRGYWTFNETYITGMKLFSLPIEELLFFLVIPQASLLMWVGMKKFSSLHALKHGYYKHLRRFKLL